MSISQEHLNALITKGFDPEKMSRYESAIYLLQNMSNTLRLEYDEYMKSYGFRGKASEMSTKINKSTDEYLKHVRTMIPDEQGMLFLLDYEDFDRQFRDFAKLEDLIPKQNKKLQLC
ncbi:MAG: hypothetical protein WCK78_04350 [Paludibacter sp.]